MVDQCGNCAFGIQRTYGTAQVLECRFKDPWALGRLANWPQVLATDWCGEYKPVGYSAGNRYIAGTQTLTDALKHQIASTSDPLYTAIGLSSYQITNAANQSAIVQFFDDPSGALLTQIGCPANQSVQGSFSPLLISAGTAIDVGLISAVSTVYVSVQGYKIRPGSPAIDISEGA